MSLIRGSKVLVVGAGGIGASALCDSGGLVGRRVSLCLRFVPCGGVAVWAGCELLKNLVLTGFQDIEVIDLDTIDVSNLNRQFLFRPHHVGRSKAEVRTCGRGGPRWGFLTSPVPCASADCPGVCAALQPACEDRGTPWQREGQVGLAAPRWRTHGADSTACLSSKFGAQYIKQFDMVLNALDNLDARRHVNRLCLATDKPLLDSGTAGYLGQVTVMKKGITECFECTPKGGQKVYPICTIRRFVRWSCSHALCRAPSSLLLLFTTLSAPRTSLCTASSGRRSCTSCCLARPTSRTPCWLPCRPHDVVLTLMLPVLSYLFEAEESKSTYMTAVGVLHASQRLCCIPPYHQCALRSTTAPRRSTIPPRTRTHAPFSPACSVTRSRRN